MCVGSPGYLGEGQGRAAIHRSHPDSTQLPSPSFVVIQPDQNILLSNLVLFEKKQYSPFIPELLFKGSFIN